MRRRPPFLIVLLPVLLPVTLGGCWADPLVGPGLVATGASLVITGRTPVDHVASAWTGRECSAVRLEQGLPWCAPDPPAPQETAYCTRSLGAVDCWTAPPAGSRRQAADPPARIPPPLFPPSGTPISAPRPP